MYTKDSLCHFGIKGMKWGRRRWQNYDGSYNQAGKERYGIGDRIKAARDSFRARLNSQGVLDERKKYKDSIKAYKKAEKAYKKHRSASGLAELKKAAVERDENKYDYNYSKAKTALAFSKKKSKRQIKLEDHYRKKGMTKEEAEVAAFKRDRVEKALMVAGGVAIGVAAAHVARRYKDINIDQYIKPGTKLSRIASDPDHSVQDGFYAIHDSSKGDKRKYAGVYGLQKILSTGDDANYRKTLVTNKGIKIASEKKCSKNIL